MTQQELTEKGKAIQITVTPEDWKLIADSNAEFVEVGERAGLPVDKLEGLSVRSAPFLSSTGLIIQGNTLCINTVGEFTVVVATYKEEAILAFEQLVDKSLAFVYENNNFLQQTVEILMEVPVDQGSSPASLETMSVEEWAAIADPAVVNVEPEIRGLLSIGTLQGLSQESAKFLANPGRDFGFGPQTMVTVDDLARNITLHYDADYEAAFEGLVQYHPDFDLEQNTTLSRVLNSLYFPTVYQQD